MVEIKTPDPQMSLYDDDNLQSIDCKIEINALNHMAQPSKHLKLILNYKNIWALNGNPCFLLYPDSLVVLPRKTI